MNPYPLSPTFNESIDLDCLSGYCQEKMGVRVISPFTEGSNPTPKRRVICNFISQLHHWRIGNNMQTTPLKSKRGRESYFNSKAHPQYNHWDGCRGFGSLASSSKLNQQQQNNEQLIEM